MALITHQCSPLMPQRTTCQTYMMQLILIFPIHKQCWEDSCPICPSWQMMSTADNLSSSTVLPVYSQYIPFICIEFIKYVHGIYYIYQLYILAKKCFYSVLSSGQQQQQQHCIWQGICLATPGNDDCHIQGCYCGPDNRVACSTANTAVPLVHRHTCAAHQ